MYQEYYSVTDKPIQEYQKRILPVYLKLMAMLIFSQGIFIFISIDLINQIKEISDLWQHKNFMVGLFGFASIIIFLVSIFISVGYFKPEKHIFRVFINKDEKKMLNSLIKNYTIDDFDKLFLYFQHEVEKNSYEASKRESIFKNHFYNDVKALKNLKDYKAKSKFIKRMQKEK